MLYDHIHNINTYASLSPDILVGLEFLRDAKPDIANGVYQLNPRVKAIVSEYETKPQNPNGYEAHKKYIDIQALLKGEERLDCLPIEWLKQTKPYSEECDAAFYSADTTLQPSSLTLRPGYFAILYPQDGHMPQLTVTAPSMVKKVVIKVAILPEGES